MTSPGELLVERLRKRAKQDRDCAANSLIVADLLQPQMELFDAREGHANLYAVRMAVDHRNSAKTDAQYADDLESAIALITQNHRPAPATGELREAVARIVDPGAWRERDSHFERADRADYPDHAKQWQAMAEEVVLPSLIKADQIIALLPATVDRAGGEWLPIDTAPRDEEILVAITVRNNKTGQEWCERHIIFIRSDDGEIDTDYEHGWRVEDYEWWRPLPAPPAIRQLADGEGK